MDELRAERSVGEPGSAGFPHERVEAGPHLVVGPAHLVEERGPAAAIGGRVAARERRNCLVLELGRIAAHDPCPRPAGGHDRREADHVVLHDRVRLELIEDRPQARLDVASAVAQGLPGRRDELAELLDRRLAEDRCRIADEVDPELAGNLGTSGGGGPSRISRSSKPWASSRPANDSSTMNTTRWPRARRTLPIPTQLFVGPNAPSGKKTIVRLSLIAH